VDKSEAQARVDRIASFTSELAVLEREGALSLTDDQRRLLADYHQNVLSTLSTQFDVDRGDAQRRMSIGMRVASIVGAVALSAAAYLFFYRIWGELSIGAQTTILVAAPLFGIALTEAASRVDTTRYFVFIASLIACACIVLNVSTLGALFAMTDSPNALLVWAFFALAIGHAYGIRTTVAAGLALLIAFSGSSIVAWGGHEWTQALRRPEAWLPVSFIVAEVGAMRLVPARSDMFAPVYRGVGLAAMLVALWMLSLEASFSALPWSEAVVKGSYQVIGFAVAGAAVAIGLRRSWTEAVNIGGAALVIFLYTKFVQWWWDWMPAYLFFLVVGLISVGLILVLRRARGWIKESRA
jgi:hypothetical protein